MSPAHIICPFVALGNHESQSRQHPNQIFLLSFRCPTDLSTHSFPVNSFRVAHQRACFLCNLPSESIFISFIIIVYRWACRCHRVRNNTVQRVLSYFYLGSEFETQVGRLAQRVTCCASLSDFCIWYFLNLAVLESSIRNSSSLG